MADLVGRTLFIDGNQKGQSYGKDIIRSRVLGTLP